MEQNTHATKCLNKVQREITFIFPNYIYEPIFCTEQIKCTNNPLVGSTITALYDIITNPQRDPHKDWKEKLAESLVLTNEALPQISNQCCYNSQQNMQETAQQTKITCFKPEEIEGNVFKGFSLSDMSLSKYCSSLNVMTSSCVSCSGFESGAECVKQTYQQSLEEIIKARTAPLNIQEVPDNYTVKNEVEDDILEELSVEEDAAAEVDIANLIKDQFLYDDKTERVETNNEYSNKKSSLIISLEPQLKENIPDVETFTDKEKLNEPALPITELLEVETPRLLNRENEPSVENISTKSEEITLPFTEVKKESIEEITNLPETVASADENQQSVLNLPDRIEESAVPIIEDASL